MRMIDGLLTELEQEAATTRRVLERIPQAHLSWRPHPKSMSLGQLALHVATVPGSVAELAASTPFPSRRASCNLRLRPQRNWCHRSRRALQRRNERSAGLTIHE